jgi:hypothetical protein
MLSRFAIPEFSAQIFNLKTLMDRPEEKETVYLYNKNEEYNIHF